MVTLVGTQSDFGNALKDLVELEYDAIEAYDETIKNLENEDYKSHMKDFLNDHKKHVEKLNEILVSHGKRSVTGPSGKRLLTKGKVILADIMGDDNSILKAMHSNEEDTNEAYHRMSAHKNKWEDIGNVIETFLEDEKKHKKWLEETLKTNNTY